MRISILYFYLFAAGAVSVTGASWDILQKIQNYFTGVREQLISRLVVADEFAAFNASFKSLLARGNLSALSEDDAALLPVELWRMYGAGSLLTLRNDTRDLVTPYLSQRVLNEMDLLQRVNVTQTQAIDRLKTLLRNTSASRMEVALLLDKLGDSWEWKEANITNLKPILFYLPIAMLTNLRDSRAIARLFNEANLCMDNLNTKSASCPSQAELNGEGGTTRAQYMLSLQAWLREKTYGDPRNWDRDTFQMLNFSSLPDFVFMRLQPDVLLSRKTEILAMMRGGLKTRALGRYVVEKIFEAENVTRRANVLQSPVSQQEIERIKAVISPVRTAGLMQFVYATDLPNEVLDADSKRIRNETDNFTTAALQDGSIDALVLENSMKSLLKSKQNFTVDQIRSLGMNRLALASGLMLNSTLKNYAIFAEDLKNLVTTIRYTAGSAARGKLMMIKNKVFEVGSSGGGTSLDLNIIPDELLNVAPMRYLDEASMSLTNRMSALGRNATFNAAQMSTLISGIGSDRLKFISSKAKEAIPTNVYKDLSKDALKDGTIGMPPSSKLGLMLSDKAFKTGTTINVDDFAVMFMQAVDARNIPTSNIVQQFENMKDGFPTRQACYVLKDLYVNYTATEMMTQSEDEAFQLLTPSAIERMPICVVAAFGPDRLRSLDDVSKTILLDRVVMNRRAALIFPSVSRAALLTIVDEGLKAKGRPSVVTGADVNTYGEILLFFPTDLMNNVTAEGAPLALGIFNSLAASVLMPCLDAGRRSAIANLITKYKGDDPTTWRQMSGLCCLLYTLPSGTLSRIPRGALMSCRCHIADRAQYASEDEARQNDCRTNLGGDYDAELWQRDNVRRVQAWAALDILDPYTIPGYNPSGRRKRALSDVAVCDRASVSGVDDITESELSAASTSDIMQCLGALGARYMDDTKAQILASKVRKTLSTRSWFALANDLMRDMNFIMKGIPANEISDLPSLSPPASFYDTVVVLGNEKMMFSDDQLRAYADKVLTTWRSLADMSDKQLAMYNRLLCGTNASLINTLSAERVGNALAYLGATLDGCSKEVLAPLALKASNPRLLSRAQVREMGVVFAGIQPDKIGGIEPSSFVGLAPAAMRAMTSDAIRAMTSSQLRSLSTTTAMAMSASVRDSLSEKQKAALNMVLGKSGASGRELSNAAVLLTLLMTIYLS
ncbi:uncharacterized protein LOC108676244 [Hyalella azteca]|uniref:Uncharacterized protein LOC108676244 n=1 Tax=Hyalella azteca TaxID=294128 RepID=A0A8B7P114_HYAAZ|nr:uncharacterized protein LOC108676244 [Hyalella azteca]